MMVEMDGRWRQTLALLVPGILAFLVAGLSVVDMFLPKPYDGVVLESDRPGTRRVRAVVPDPVLRRPASTPVTSSSGSIGPSSRPPLMPRRSSIGTASAMSFPT
jgi:hypothetical protein